MPIVTRQYIHINNIRSPWTHKEAHPWTYFLPNMGEVRARSVLVYAGQHATCHIKNTRRWVRVPGDDVTRQCIHINRRFPWTHKEAHP